MSSASPAVAGSVVVHMSGLTSPGAATGAVYDPTLSRGYDIFGRLEAIFDYEFGEI
jgi:hypothetical protein